MRRELLEADRIDTPPKVVVSLAPAMLTVAALAGYLSLSQRQIWKLVAIGKLPSPVSPPDCRRRLWRRADVDEAIDGWD